MSIPQQIDYMIDILKDAYINANDNPEDTKILISKALSTLGISKYHETMEAIKEKEVDCYISAANLEQLYKEEYDKEINIEQTLGFNSKGQYIYQDFNDFLGLSAFDIILFKNLDNLLFKIFENPKRVIITKD